MTGVRGWPGVGEGSCLKIDRSFTNAITPHRGVNAPIHTVQRGRDLGLATVAEGGEPRTIMQAYTISSHGLVVAPRAARRCPAHDDRSNRSHPLHDTPPVGVGTATQDVGGGVSRRHPSTGAVFEDGAVTWQLGRTTLVALDDTVVRPGSEAVFCRCIPAPRGTTRVTELTGRNAAQNDTAARLVIAHIPGTVSGTAGRRGDHGR